MSVFQNIIGGIGTLLEKVNKAEIPVKHEVSNEIKIGFIALIGLVLILIFKK